MRMREKLMAFFREEEGLTTVEYAVAGALIVVVIIAAFETLGGNVSDVINAIATAIEQ